MAKIKTKKLHSNIVSAFCRLDEEGGLLCRQYSQSEEAEERGGKYLYFVVKNNTKFPTGAGKFLIENGLVKPSADGLFEDTPQTFRAVPRSDFSRFRENYEAQPNV